MSALAQTNCGDIISGDLTLVNDVASCDSSNGLVINTSGVTLDCNGHVVHSNTHSNNGIVLGKSVDGAIIKNCKILNFDTGIFGSTCSNNSNIIIQDTSLDNSTTGITFASGATQCGINKYFFRNLTLSNLNFSSLFNAADIDVDGCNFNNLRFSCDLNTEGAICHTAAFFDNIRNCNINGWHTSSAWGTGIFIGGDDFRADNVTLNNIFLNVTNRSGGPYGLFIQNSRNITIDNSSIVSDDESRLAAVFHDLLFPVVQTKVIDTSYPYGKEKINTGDFLRYFRVNITTSIGNISINLTSLQNELTSASTDDSGLLSLNLLAYKRDSIQLINSTPYKITAFLRRQSFNTTLSIGDRLNNSIFFLRFFNDTDDDGINNSADNCRFRNNPDQSDIDSDLTGDVCDACPADATNSCNPDESASRSINSSGGIVLTNSGDALVNIPDNALTNDTSISISGSNATPNINLSSFIVQTNATAASLIYSFGPEGLQFSTFVTIRLKYNDSGIDENTVDIYFFNISTGLWHPQNATCNKILNVCTLNVSHFSEFLVGGFSDSDADGITDEKDKCPLTAGKIAYQGCPAGDEISVQLHVIDKAKTFCNGEGSCKVAVGNADVKVFDRNNLDFKTSFTKNPKKAFYADVYEADIGKIGDCTTHNDGKCIAGKETTGDYLAIVKFVDAETNTTIYEGKPESPEDFTDTDGDGIPDFAFKELQILKTINKDSSIVFRKD